MYFEKMVEKGMMMLDCTDSMQGIPQKKEG